jgi:hypothetical protein
VSRLEEIVEHENKQRNMVQVMGIGFVAMILFIFAIWGLYL